MLRYLILLIMPLLLSSCLVGKHGYIHNRKNVYLHSENLPSTHFPANLQPAEINPSYAIPHGKGFSTQTSVSIIPPGNEGELTSSEKQAVPLNVGKIALGQGSDGFPVLKVPTDYKTAWAKVTKILPKEGYQIMGSDAKTGVIEVMASAKEKQASHIYQFNVLQGKNAVLISVLDQSGDNVAEMMSKKLLTQLETGLRK